MSEFTVEQERIIQAIMFAEAGRRSDKELLAVASTIMNVIEQEGFKNGTKRFSSFYKGDPQFEKFMSGDLNRTELEAVNKGNVALERVANDPEARMPFNRFENETAFGEHPEAENAIGERIKIGQQVFFTVPDTKKPVRDIQNALIQHGFDVGEVDGINGEKTNKAIRDFQEANGLNVDGIVGPNTKPVLFNNFGITPLTR